MNPQATQTSLVKCGERRPAQPLSVLDLMAGVTPVKRAAAFSYRLDAEKLLTSLRACLREFPLFCGRLREPPDGKTVIECNDAGLRYTLIDVDRTMPRYGYAQPLKAEFDQLTEPLVHGPINRDEPIVGIRVTRFLDGTVIGITNSHVLMDGVGAWLFLERWSQHFRAQLPELEVTFERAPLFQAAQAAKGETPESSLTLGRQPVSVLRLGGFIARVLLSKLTGATALFHMSAAMLAAQKSQLSARLPAGEWVSTQDVAMSVMVQAVAAATELEELQVGTIYEVRRVPELGLSPHYIGNAAAGRTFTARSAELAQDPLKVARSMRQMASTVTPQRVRDDLKDMQARITRKNAMRYLPGFLIEQFGNGLMLNNYSRFPIYRADFGSGPPSWGDYPRVPLNRVITLCPDPKGDGVAVHLTLPRAEMRRFVQPQGTEKGIVLEL